MEEKVEEIGTKWDNWIENNGIESLSDRRKNIQSLIENLLVEIDADENLKDIKKLVLKAKLITVYPEYRSRFTIFSYIQGSTHRLVRGWLRAIWCEVFRTDHTSAE